MLVALLAGKATAAELGDVTVHSFAGQPLVADIALTALTPDELTRLQVRLATPDVYRGANLRMHPALASLRMTVMQEEGQRQFVHVTTRQAIDADYLHLFFELSSGERHSVRAVTVWLSAKPTPAAPVAPVVPVAAPAPVVMPPSDAVRAAREPASTAASDAKLASETRSQAKPRSTPEPKPRSTPRSTSKPKASPQAEANRERAEQQSRDNAALDIENAALRTKIDTLEQKVAVLQQNHAARLLASRPAAAVPAPVPARAGWTLWIGAASALLLLLVSGALVFLYRKKIAGLRHWMALSKRLRRKAAPPAAPVAPIEPE
jgi:pilus assembly protein FimV